MNDERDSIQELSDLKQEFLDAVGKQNETKSQPKMEEFTMFVEGIGPIKMIPFFSSMDGPLFEGKTHKLFDPADEGCYRAPYYPNPLDFLFDESYRSLQNDASEDEYHL